MHNQKNNAEIDKTGMTGRLYSIRNVAILAAKCPENSVEVYLLQDIANHIADMVQELIEDIGA
jgi:hypothetical protein